MFVAYTAKIRGIIECMGIIMVWINRRILSVQSLEAHHCIEPYLVSYSILDCQVFLFVILCFHLVCSFLE